MITDAIINLGFTILNWFITLFPVSTGFSTDIHTAFSTFGGYVGMFTGILPYSIIAAAIGIIFAVEIAIFLFKTTKWVISHLPAIGGRG